MTTTEENELLAKLQAMITQKESPKLETLAVWNKYKSTHTLHAETLRNTSQIINRFAKSFQYLPDNSLAIDEYINNLTNLKYPDKPSAISTKISHFAIIKGLIQFAVSKLDFTNYLEKLSPPKSNATKQPRTIWNEDLLNYIEQNLPNDYHKLVYYTCVDSDCRIGELSITKEHDCPRIKDVHLEIEKLDVWGKSGYHEKHCSLQLCELLIQHANPTTGALFHDNKNPNGFIANNLFNNMRSAYSKILKNTDAPKRFLGSHTIRHTIASLIADTYSNSMLVQKFLSHTDYRMSQKYIHDSKDRRMTMPSPLQMIGSRIHSENQPHPVQPLMITDGSNSTTIVPLTQQPIETVEATIDFAEQMFPRPKFEFKSKRVTISMPELQAVLESSRFYQRHSSEIDPIPGILSRMTRHWLQK